MAMSAAPEDICWAAPAIVPKSGMISRNDVEYSHIDPPADSEQNSNNPSNAGLSSPTRTAQGEISSSVTVGNEVSVRTSRSVVCEFFGCFW